MNDVPPAASIEASLPDFPQVPPAPPRRRRWYRRPTRILAILVALLIAWLAITAPLSKSLQPIAPPGITLLSADGRPIARQGAISDQPVDVTQLPEHIPQAFVAIEDRRFYMHTGVDPWAIFRAAVRNTLAGGVREGGSTITQQLAKLSFLSSDQTAGRKLRELFIAIWLEAWLTKEEILSRYLSNAYFGDNVYGLRAASRHYFSKQPEELSVPEAALLAGLLKAPSRLAPTLNLKGARTRGKLVERAMLDAGYLSESEAKRLKQVTLKTARAKSLPTGTFFADWVLPHARAAAGTGYGEQTVATTLDSRLQRLAIRSVNRAGLGSAQVALIAMRPSGEIVAMLGGKDYSTSTFNRATQARRQPGSTFKLFVYLAALRSGLDPDSMIEDEPLTIGSYSPRNNDGRYRGRISLRQAFAISSNVAAVRLAERVGRKEVIRAARDLGVTSPLVADPTLALGTSDMTLLELTRAYAAIAAGSYPVKARGLPKAEESWFGRMFDGKRGLGGGNEEMMRDLLWNAVNRGTGRAAALGKETFGKTGTTQDHRDAIFVGFAGDLVTAVWIGNDDNSPLKGIQGGGLPARIWRDFMSGAVGSPIARAQRRAEPRRQAPAREREREVSVPIEGTGYELGIEVGEQGMTISAQPEADSREGPRPPVPLPRTTIPVPAPAPAQEDEPEPRQ
jgi:penicillin-binding protein 1A